MKRSTRRATILLCSVAVAAMAGSAYAKPVHKKAAHRHSHHRTAAAPAAPMIGDATMSGVDRDMRYSASSMQARQSQADHTPATTRRGRRTQAHSYAMAQQTTPQAGGFSSSVLVSEARKYLGTNPTGRGSLWCGAFMDLVLQRTGHRGGGNLAKAYANYGRRVSGPQVGAIAVMGRKGGGHVGVVSGVDPNGNPIIISGNHNRTTAESVYPKGRIMAYVMPN